VAILPVCREGSALHECAGRDAGAPRVAVSRLALERAPASWSAAVLLPFFSVTHGATEETAVSGQQVVLRKKTRQKDSRTPKRWRAVGHAEDATDRSVRALGDPQPLLEVGEIILSNAWNKAAMSSRCAHG